MAWSHLKILVVEDSPSIIQQLSEILAKLLPGARIATAKNVPAARDIFHATKPGLVFLDIRLSDDIDGAQFMSIHERATHRSEVVVLTALPRTHPDVLAAIGHGAAGFVAKPLRYRDVEDVLHGIGILADVGIAVKDPSTEHSSRHARGPPGEHGPGGQ